MIRGLILAAFLVYPTYVLADQVEKKFYSNIEKNYKQQTGAKRGFSLPYAAGIDLREYDENGDQSYALEEIVGFYLDIFNKIDVNSDKRWEESEFEALLDIYKNDKNLNEHDMAVVSAQADEKYQKLDSNTDKYVSEEEFMKTEVPSFIENVSKLNKHLEMIKSTQKGSAK